MSAKPPPSQIRSQPKVMSSRLSSMKFMQRASASQPLPPSPSPPGPDSTPPSSKRQKFSQVSSLTSKYAVDDTGEVGSGDSWTRWSAHGGETKWEFNYQSEERVHEDGIKVESVGLSEIEPAQQVQSRQQEPWRPSGEGRRSFGQFKSTGKQNSQEKLEDSSSSDDDDGNGSDNDASGGEVDDASGTATFLKSKAAARVKAERKARRKAERTETKRLAEKRKQKEVKLNRLSSISGTGGNAKKRSKGNASECYSCGRQGHLKKDCPNRGK